MKTLKFTFFVASCFGLLAAMAAIFQTSHNWEKVMIALILGFAFGFVGAPEIQPKLYIRPYIYQAGGGFLAGIALGFLCEFNADNIVYSAIIGGTLGWLAPYWIKHASFP